MRGRYSPVVPSQPSYSTGGIWYMYIHRYAAGPESPTNPAAPAEIGKPHRLVVAARSRAEGALPMLWRLGGLGTPLFDGVDKRKSSPRVEEAPRPCLLL